MWLKILLIMTMRFFNGFGRGLGLRGLWLAGCVIVAASLRGADTVRLYTVQSDLARLDGAAVGGDSLGVTLGEVVVKARQGVRVGEKTVYRPEGELVRVVNSGVQLLAGLGIPELVVDVATGTVSLMGGGRLQVRINGRPASVSEVAALSPRDIVKVEYIGDPGMRYGDYDGVLDISVRRTVERGATVFANLLQSVNRGWGDYTVSLKYNIGRSHWGVDYHSNPMWQMDCYRDNVERIVTADGAEVTRTENGVAVPNRMVTHRAAMTYSYAQGRDILLNVQGRLYRTDNRYATEGEIVTITDEKEVRSYEREVNPVRSWQGDLDVYLHKRIGSRHTVCVNIVPTWTDSHSAHEYDTDGVRIDNRLNSRGMRLLGEALWEGRIGCGMLSAGLRGNGVWTDTDNGVRSFREEDGRGSVFAQWKQSSEQWQYYVGGEMGRYSWEIRDVSQTDGRSLHVATLLGGFRAYGRYVTEKCGAVSLYAEGVTKYPGLDERMPTLQRIDGYQWYSGQPDLKPWQQYTARIKYDHRIREVAVGLQLGNVRAVNPVMTAKTYVDGMILSMPINHGYNNHFEVKGNVRLPLLSGLLTVTAEGGWHLFKSHGERYHHSYSQPFVNAQLMVMRSHWWVMVKYNSAYNVLWGEKISTTNNNLLNIGVGYTYRSATVMAGVVNPIGNVALRSRDLSALAGYERIYQAASSRQLVWVGVTLNLHHGKRKAQMQKKLDNTHQYKSINNVTK